MAVIPRSSSTPESATTTTSHDGGLASKTKVAIGVGVTVPVVILILLFLSLYVWKRRRCLQRSESAESAGAFSVLRVRRLLGDQEIPNSNSQVAQLANEGRYEVISPREPQRELYLASKDESRESSRYSSFSNMPYSTLPEVVQKTQKRDLQELLPGDVSPLEESSWSKAKHQPSIKAKKKEEMSWKQMLGLDDHSLLQDLTNPHCESLN